MATWNSWVLTFLSNALWQIPLLGAGAALAARLLYRAPARFRHAFWVAALILSVALPLVSLRTPPRREAGGRSQAAPATPAARGHDPAEAPYPSTLLPPSSSTDERTPSSPLPVATQPPRTSWAGFLREHRLPVSLPPGAAMLVVAAYLIFLFYRAARLAVAWRRTEAIRAGAVRRELPPGVAALAANLQAALGSRETGILSSRDVAGPQTLGVRSPVILLPAGFLEMAPADDVAAALSHEMAHVCRQDFALNLLCEFFLLPIAFHPVAAILKKRIEETRELACDELAAARFSCPSAYAHSLVNLARRIAAPPAQPGYSLGVFDANFLEERVLSLLDQRRRMGPRRAAMLLSAAALALAVTGLAACLFSLTARVRAADQSLHEAPNVARAFAGTWRATAQGKTWLILSLRQQRDQLTGSINIGGMRLDQQGQVEEVTEEPKPASALAITAAEVRNGILYFQFHQPWGGPLQDVEMNLVGNNAAELKFPASGVEHPWRVSKDSDAAQHAVVEGVSGGVIAAVPGGVVKGIKGGVVHGVIGGAPQIAEENKPGKISGVVADPSGARVPNAFVSLFADSGFHESDVTNEVGEFSFSSLSAGRYHLKVKHEGFAVFERRVGIMPDGAVEFQGKSYAQGSDGAAPHLEIGLEPGQVMQSMVVTAKAPPSVLEKRSAKRPQRIRVGGQVEASKLVAGNPPAYPESARMDGIEGTVLLEAVISIEGVPLSLHVLRSPDPALSEAALAAVRDWHYKPTLLNGQPIEVVTTIAVEFHLEE